MPAVHPLIVRRLVATLLALAGLVAVAGSAAAEVERPTRRGKAYRVRIDSAPQEAAVYLDDERYGIVGYTPYSSSLQVGSWTIIVKKNGYEVGRRVVNVARRSGVQEIFLPLVRKSQPGVIEVRADADPDALGAEIWIDGQSEGTIPVTAKVPGGRHLVELRKGGAAVFSQWVEVKDGDRFTVNPTLKAEPAAAGSGRIRITSSVRRAEVIFDGLAVGRAPLELDDIEPGDHIVVVRAPGHRQRRQTVKVLPGSVQLLAMDLTNVSNEGTLRVTSNVIGSEVYIDDERLGPAPQDKALSAGEHVVEVRKPGHETFSETVVVSAAERITVAAELLPAGKGKDAGGGDGGDAAPAGEGRGDEPLAAPANLERERDHLEQRGLSAFGARPLGSGHSVVVLGGGYPYLADLRFVVGAGRALDLGVGLRLAGDSSELGLVGRLNLVDAGPFALGAFVEGGGGVALASRASERNSLFASAGAALSLSGAAVTVTGRAFAAMWSERFCPSLDASGAFGSDTKPSKLCRDYLAGTLDPADRARVDDLVGSTGKLFQRSTGLRPMASLAVEIAMSRDWSAWLLIDAALSADAERAGLSRPFNRLLLGEDFLVYPRLGLTAKF
jgi:hypothetical protein